MTLTKEDQIYIKDTVYGAFSELAGIMTDKFDEVDRRFEQIDKRFDEVDRQFAEVRADIAEIKAEIKSIELRLSRIEKNSSEETELMLADIIDLKKRLLVAEKQLKALKA